MLQLLGPEKRKHPTRAGLRVQPVGELGFYARGFKQKWQRPAPCRQGSGQALGIAPGLNLNAFEGGTFFFGLDHAAGLAVHIKQVVGKAVAGVEGEFADGDAQRCVQIDLIDMAHVPASGLQELVDVDTGLGFGVMRFIRTVQTILVNLKVQISAPSLWQGWP